MSANVGKLIADGRARLTAAIDEGKQQVVLSAEGETDATTDLLIWAGNNMPAILDALEAHELQVTRFKRRIARLNGRIAELEDTAEGVQP